MLGGRIELGGDDVTGLSSAELVERGLVQVPQGRHLFGEMSVRENLGRWAPYLVARSNSHTRMREVFCSIPDPSRTRAAAGGAAFRRRAADARGRARLMSGASLSPDGRAFARPCAEGVRPLILDVVKRINGGGTTVFIAEQNARRVYASLTIPTSSNLAINTEGESAVLLADDRIQLLSRSFHP